VDFTAGEAFREAFDGVISQGAKGAGKGCLRLCRSTTATGEGSMRKDVKKQHSFFAANMNPRILSVFAFGGRL